jgi:hypothetical protein
MHAFLLGKLVFPPNMLVLLCVASYVLQSNNISEMHSLHMLSFHAVTSDKKK